MKTILCVSHVAPWPATSGNERRLQKLLAWLRQKGYQTVLILTNPPAETDQVGRIQALVDRVEFATTDHPLLQISSRKQKLKRWLQRGGPFAQSHRYKRCRHPSGTNAMQDLADQLCPPHVNKLVRQLLHEQRVDACIASYAFTIQAFDGLPRRIKVICDTVEVFSLTRCNAEGVAIQPVLSFTPEEERCMLSQCDVAVGIQEVESSYIKQLIPELKVVTVGIDSELANQPGLPSEAAEVIGIIGSSNPANREGLQIFLQECWPRIRQARATAEVHIAGRLGVALEQESSSLLPDGVKILGWLADLDGFYRSLRLAVNPVRRGTGLKIKTVEALAHDRPVVSYSVGLEGMIPADPAAWIEVQDPASMADICASLLANPHACDQLAAGARNYTRQHLSSESVYQPLLSYLPQP